MRGGGGGAERAGAGRAARGGGCYGGRKTRLGRRGTRLAPARR